MVLIIFRLFRPRGGKSHESHVCGTDVISGTKVTGESLCATSRNHVRGARKLRVGRAKPTKAAITMEMIRPRNERLTQTSLFFQFFA